MSLHRNRVQMTVSGTPGTGTITLNAASSGYQSLATAYAADATVDILVTEGTSWEVARDCTYTNVGTTVTRGTLEASSTGSAISFTSAAIVSVIFSAGAGQQLALNHVALADANTTMVVGTMYVGSMAAWATADRTYTLPTTANVGDRIGVMITGGNASTFELILTAATSDTLNGVAGGTEWSRLFITGEVVIMRCVTANSAWVVELDGRIPQVGRMSLITSDITTSTAGAWTPSVFNSADIALGCVVAASGSGTATITVRRSGAYAISGGVLGKNGVTLTDQEQFGWACSANGNVGVGTLPAVFSNSRASGTANQGNAGVTGATLVAGDVLQHNFIWGTTANGGMRALTYASFLFVQESI